MNYAKAMSSQNPTISVFHHLLCFDTIAVSKGFGFFLLLHFQRQNIQINAPSLHFSHMDFRSALALYQTTKNNELCREIVNHIVADYTNMLYVPTLTLDMCMAALVQEQTMMNYVPTHLIPACVLALYRRGINIALSWVVPEHQTLEMCELAVLLDTLLKGKKKVFRNRQFVASRFRAKMKPSKHIHTTEEYSSMFMHQGYDFCAIPSALLTPLLCYIAVQRDHTAFPCVPRKFRSLNLKQIAANNGSYEAMNALPRHLVSPTMHAAVRRKHAWIGSFKQQVTKPVVPVRRWRWHW